MVVAHGHIIQYIHKIHACALPGIIAVNFLRGLVVIAISQLLDLHKKNCQLKYIHALITRVIRIRDISLEK